MAEPSSSAVQVVVLGYEEHSLTGHMAVHVQTVTQSSLNLTIRGPVKTYGIDPDAVAKSFGDIDTWLAWVKTTHQKFTGINQTMSARLAAVKGKAL